MSSFEIRERAKEIAGTPDYPPENSDAMRQAKAEFQEKERRERAAAALLFAPVTDTEQQETENIYQQEPVAMPNPFAALRTATPKEKEQPDGPSF